jgi:hypothetical protein
MMRRRRIADGMERLDRKLGTLLSRIAGTIAGIGGLAAAWNVLTLDDFSFGTYWPVLGFSMLLLVIARICFKGRPSFLDMMSEVPGDSLSPRSRRDVAINDERGSEH